MFSFGRTDEGFVPPIDEFAESLRPLARRLIRGSARVHGSFAQHVEIMRAYRADKGRILQPSLRFRARVIALQFKATAAEATNSIRRGIRNYNELENLAPDLQKKQTPLAAVVACSDSRVEVISMLDARLGEKFILKNVGGSIEHPNDPNTLSDDAKEVITYANHMGVPRLIIFTHGKCGCIANAADPRHDQPLPDTATVEDEILRRMALRKRHIRDQVEDPEQERYLGSVISTNFCNGDRKLLLMEIAHGLHSKKLAEDFIKTLPVPEGKQPMEVVLVHQELRTLNIYMHNPQTGTYLRLTNHKPIPGIVEAVAAADELADKAIAAATPQPRNMWGLRRTKGALPPAVAGQPQEPI